MQSISNLVANVPSFSLTKYALKLSMACILLWHQYGLCAEINRLLRNSPEALLS